jgi:GNAT superfamily N-acetyltransferase
MFELMRLTPDDWQAYRALRLAALADAPEAFGSTLAKERGLDEAAWRAKLGYRVQFVARQGGAAVGTAGGERCGDVAGAALLVFMWVAPGMRGCGVGDVLVRTVLEWARAQGLDPVRAWVTEGNLPAERLYARHGFVRTGERQPIREEDPTRLELAMSRPA